jgi:ferredoxin
MTTSRTVRIDTQVCEGHGRCYALFPEIFYDDDSGYGVVNDDVDLADSAMLETAWKAVEVCPESAISIVEG